MHYEICNLVLLAGWVGFRLQALVVFASSQRDAQDVHQRYGGHKMTKGALY